MIIKGNPKEPEERRRRSERRNIYKRHETPVKRTNK